MAENPGFKSDTVSSVLVQVDQVTHVELTLEVGSVTESVQVEAVAPLLENDKSTISSVVDTRTIANMPLNARQFLDLALLTPGAVPSQPGQQGGGFNVAGARSQSNLFLLDGVSNMDTQIGSALGNFRITDAVQEFAVQTSVPTAEFGRGHGAQVSIVTKSGTNQFHGSVFEYLRNSDFDAADFFTNKLRRHEEHAAPEPVRRHVGRTDSQGQDVLLRFLGRLPAGESDGELDARAHRRRARHGHRSDLEGAAAILAVAQRPPGSTINFIANVGASTFDNTGAGQDRSQLQRQAITLTGRWAEYQGTAVTAGVASDAGRNQQRAGQPLGRAHRDSHLFAHPAE